MKPNDWFTCGRAAVPGSKWPHGCSADRSRFATCAIATAVMGVWASCASGAVPTLIVSENVLQVNGSTITSLVGPVVNGVGGYAIRATVNTNLSGPQAGNVYVYGTSAAGAPGGVLVADANQTVNVNGTPTPYNARYIGSFSLGDDGSVAYSLSGRYNNQSPTLGAVFKQSGSTSTAIAVDQTAIGGTSAYAGKYFGDGSGLSADVGQGGVQQTRDGSAVYWVGTVANTSGGALAGTAVFRSSGSASDPTPILKTGDPIAGNALVASGLTVSNESGAVSSNTFHLSPNGTKYVTAVLVGSGSSNDSVLVTGNGTAGGTATGQLRQGTVAAGGNGTETWSSFGAAAINDAGHYVVGGYTSSSDPSAAFFVAQDGVIVLRGGQTVPVAASAMPAGSTATTAVVAASGSASVAINSAGDYAASFSTSTANAQIFVDGQVVAEAGTPVDTNGDGAADSTLSAVNGSAGVALTDRLTLNGATQADVYFLAKVSGASGFSLFDETVTLASAPEPGSAALLGAAVAGLASGRRRRRVAAP